MKLLITLFVFLFLTGSSISFAQPIYSPIVRAERETVWMRDSLSLKPAQTDKAKTINMAFYKDMDKASQTPDTSKKNKSQELLRHRKMAEMKNILNKMQYKKYFRHEKEQEYLEQQKAIRNKGGHRPL